MRRLLLFASHFLAGFSKKTAIFFANSLTEYFHYSYFRVVAMTILRVASYSAF